MDHLATYSPGLWNTTWGLGFGFVDNAQRVLSSKFAR